MTTDEEIARNEVKEFQRLFVLYWRELNTQCSFNDRQKFGIAYHLALKRMENRS